MTVKQTLKRAAFKTILRAMAPAFNLACRIYPRVAERLKEHDCVVQLKLVDGSIARFLTFEGGRVSSNAGMHSDANVCMSFIDVDAALDLLMPPQDRAKIVHAAKNFRAMMDGDDALINWFMQLTNLMQTEGLKRGTVMPDGSTRYTTNTNGGPLFVFVKEERIIRMTPIVFDEDDAASWTINARGKSFTPARRGMINPHAQCLKSLVYSEKRILTPLKRVDFDPNGERNPQNRGISGYEPISWDEALDTVVGEITRQRTVHGPGSIAIHHGSHHQWGNIGYFLSALQRFGNMVGVTRIHPNPDSWEGWYWGAMHHFGGAQRVGLPGFYSTVEDCLKEAEMIVFWSSDPESTHGYASGAEGSQRRLWARELGIEMIHIDPHCNPTAQLLGGTWIAPKPTTDSALALAIMYVWIKEELYDKSYIAQRTNGFEAWRDYLLGEDDGTAKTPEWQEAETGVPARSVRALARAWGRKKTYLAAGGLGAGFGGAGRSASGAQWARHMILLNTMQGWGKPGVNFGNLQVGTPVDHRFYFPGYAEGGFSGDFSGTAAGVNNYQRMPHVLSMNPIAQLVPRQKLPEAIIDGHTEGYAWNFMNTEDQFAKSIQYPLAGYSPIHMLYRYGSSMIGTHSDSSRYVEMYRHDSVECVVNQSIFMEGDTLFADIILPACTSFERDDISEWGNSGAILHHNTDQLNHRIVVMQHKCIEPLGESKSDYKIFTDILERLGLGTMFTEGCSEFDWVKNVFDSTDLPRYISWKKFLKKGYFVVPSPPEGVRDPVYFRWYAEGRKKDVPEPHPLPAQYQRKFGEGLPTQSGKIEFESSSLKRGAPDNSDRPALNRHIRAWEGPHTDTATRYPLQMLTAHPRYSFHTYGDSKNTTLNDIVDHRVTIEGHDYWLLRMHPDNAAKRGIKHHDIVRVYNDRAQVLCAADVSPLMMAGVVKGFESSAEYQPFNDPRFGPIDRGGSLNVLTPSRSQVKDASAMASSACQVEVAKWEPVASVTVAQDAAITEGVSA